MFGYVVKFDKKADLVIQSKMVFRFVQNKVNKWKKERVHRRFLY